MLIYFSFTSFMFTWFYARTCTGGSTSIGSSNFMFLMLTSSGSSLFCDSRKSGMTSLSAFSTLLAALCSCAKEGLAVELLSYVSFSSSRLFFVVFLYKKNEADAMITTRTTIIEIRIMLIDSSFGYVTKTCYWTVLILVCGAKLYTQCVLLLHSIFERYLHSFTMASLPESSFL